MRSRSILVLLGAAILAALVWLGSRGGRVDSSVDRVVAPANPLHDETFADTTGIERASAAQFDSVARADVEPSPAIEEDSAELANSPSAATREFVLRVVTHDTQTPVEGAEILFFEEFGLDFAKLLRRGPIDPRHATRTITTDADGHASLPQPRQSGVAFARKDGRTGHTFVNPTRERTEDIKLVPDSALRVSVVDLAGAPLAGIAVTLRLKRGPYRRDHGAFLSDERGELELPHARMLITTSSDIGGEWFAAVRGVFEEPIQRRVVHATLGETVRLVVPPFGSCDVELRDARGELETGSFDAALDITRKNRPTRDAYPALMHDGVLLDDVANGVAHFSVVQVGRELTATAKTGSSDSSVTASGMGPMTAGTNAKLSLRTADSKCVLVGRVVEQKTSLPPDSNVRARVDRLDGRISAEVELGVDLADNGEFRIAFTPPTEVASRRLVLHTSGDSRMEELAAHAQLPDVMRAGELNLGELVLVDAPMLASGVVLDAHGAPVADTNVRVLSARRYRDSDQWSPLRDVQTHTDSAGEFVLRTSLVLPRFRVSATPARQQVQSDTLSGPTEGVVLRAPPTGALAGRILLDEIIASDLGPQLILRPNDAAMGVPQSQALDLESADGEFVLNGLSVGEYTVALMDDSATTSIAEFANVRVRADEITRDPRLDPLDLRGTLRELKLTVVSADGSQLNSPWIISRVRWNDDRIVVSHHAIRGNVLELLCGNAGVDVRVGADDCAEIEQLTLLEDTRFVLRPAPKVVLSLPDDVAATLHERRRIAVVLRRDSFEPTRRFTNASTYFESKTLEVSAPAFGKTRIELWLWVHKSGRNTTRITLEPEQTFEVRGERTHVDVRITLEDIERAFASLNDE